MATDGGIASPPKVAPVRGHLGAELREAAQVAVAVHAVPEVVHRVTWPPLSKTAVDQDD